MRFVPPLCLCLLTACSSSPYLMDTKYEDESTADGSAYAGKGMHYRKPMPDHTEDKSWEFYYKRCSLSGQDNVFSGRAYECTPPR